jgi:hypothetical protein
MLSNGNEHDEQHQHYARHGSKGPVAVLLGTHQQLRTSVFEFGRTDEHAVRPLPLGGWGAVVDNYQRACELAGLVTDLLTEAGFPEADGYTVTATVDDQGEPAVRVHACPAVAARLRHWLASHAPSPPVPPPPQPGRAPDRYRSGEAGPAA